MSEKSLAGSRAKAPLTARLLGTGVILLLAIHLSHHSEDLATTPSSTSDPGIAPVSVVAQFNLPLRFEKNVGQFDTDVAFVTRSSDLMYYLKRGEVKVADIDENGLRELLSFRFENARRNTIPEPSQRLGTVTNHYLGEDPENWHTGVPNYGAVHYQQIYPGIDVTFYGNGNRLEFDFMVHPGVDPDQIKMSFSGHERLEIDADGYLRLHSDQTEILFRPPDVYQETEGTRMSIPARYVRSGDAGIGFAVGDFDDRLPLVIDPVIEYATYLGTPAFDKISDIAVAPDGSVFLTGESDRLFITKVNSEGTGITYETYFGGSTTFAEPNGIAVGSDGLPVIVGYTRPDGFPVLDPIQSGFGGGTHDGFIVRFNDGGSVAMGSFFGGSGLDILDGVQFDEGGNLYLFGRSTSNDYLITEGAYQEFRTDNAFYTATITKLNTAYETVFSTFIGSTGGNSAAEIKDIAIDDDGSLFIAGRVAPLFIEQQPNDFPVTGGVLKSGSETVDGFVSKLNPLGTALEYSTYIGGDNSSTDFGDDESVVGIAVDSEGNALITGKMQTTDFPFVNAIQQGNDGAYVAKLNANGSRFIFSSFLDGQSADIALDRTGDIYVGGGTSTATFPTVNSVQETIGGGQDAFITIFDADGSAYSFSSFLGGTGGDTVLRLAVGPGDLLYLAGITGSVDFPLVAAFEEEYGGGTQDGFLVRVRLDDAEEDLAITPNPVLFPFVSPGGVFRQTVTIENVGDRDVEVSGISVAPSSLFSLPDDPETPIELLPGFRFEFDIAYAPSTNPALDEGTLTVLNATSGASLAVPLRTGGIVVTSLGDQSDPNTSDRLCDIDPVIPGNQCTLRAAFETANAESEGSVVPISFNVPDVSTPVFRPETPLPPLTRPVSIAGESQPGAGFVVLDGDDCEGVCRGLIVEGGNSRITGLTIVDFLYGLVIVKEGENHVENCVLTDHFNGMHLSSSGNSVVDNTISGNASTGIVVGIAVGMTSGNLIESNRIGINALGTEPLANKMWGIRVSRSDNTTIRDNRIAGNGVNEEDDDGENREAGGIYLVNSSANTIESNQIGLPFANKREGIRVGSNSHGNIIRENTISNNLDFGINLTAEERIAPQHNVIENNRIGTGPLGSSGMGNGILGVACNGSHDNTIVDNIISGNTTGGIYFSGCDRNHVVRNKIGTDLSGRSRIESGNFGIVVVRGLANQLSGNLTSGLAYAGIYVELGEADVFDNRIGGDVDGADPAGNLGNFRNGLELRDTRGVVARNHVLYNGTGMLIRPSGGGRPGSAISSFAVSVSDNDIADNSVGIILKEAAPVITANRIYDNVSGIVAEEESRVNIFNNEIADNTGTGSGIHLTDSRANIKGNQIVRDAGDAIVLEGKSTAIVNNNNVAGNVGFGLKNAATDVIDATSNWWGDGSGPSGSGDGTGDAVNDAVDFSNWKRSALAVTATAERDTLVLPLGETDTVTVFVKNWQVTDDLFDYSLLESRTWLAGMTPTSADGTGVGGDKVDLVFSIPADAQEGSSSYVELTATSVADNFDFDYARFHVVAESAALAGILVAPDTVVAAPGDSVYFDARGFDQFSRPASVDAVWSATGGTIDAEGLYVAGSETGAFNVTAMNASGTLVDTAFVSIGPLQTASDDQGAIPSSVRLRQNYPNPFNPETTIRFELPGPTPVELHIYNMLGQLVKSLVMAEYPAGLHQVSWDGHDATGHPVATGVYVYQLTTGEQVQAKTMVLLR